VCFGVLFTLHVQRVTNSENYNININLVKHVLSLLTTVDGLDARIRAVHLLNLLIPGSVM
jgi:predicted small integral membrane protein